jgi:WD40 repeat protein
MLRAIAIAAHTSMIRSLAISHSGELVASCGDDHFVRVWDLAKILGKK